ncbi:MAG: MATE family efflux transporter [Bacillota bacterium]|nr:MATE family efflux transporter [Bacillota bacterium]
MFVSVVGLAVMLTMGLAHGCQPLMGYSYGANKYNRLLETIKRSIAIGTIMNTVFAILFFAFSGLLIRVFINDANVIDLGEKIIRAFVLAMLFLGIQMVLMVTFQSLGKTVESLIISLGRQGLFFIPALIIFSSLWGFYGFIFAQPVADIATTSLSLTLFLILKKKLLISSEEIAVKDV